MIGIGENLIMDICIIGKGGKEDALQKHAKKHGHTVKLITGTLDTLVRQAEGSDLTIVGPEQPLVDNISEMFASTGLRLFGPSREASELEGSKAFAKVLMRKYGIPTAEYDIAATPEDAKISVMKLMRQDGCGVIKADGLAAGKGVILFNTQEDGYAAIDQMMVTKVFGLAGEKVVIERRLRGTEISFIALTDGKTVLPLASSQDHKAVYERVTDRERFKKNTGFDFGQTGYNTGGMGAFSPSPLMDERLYARIMDRIMSPAVRAMAEDCRPFMGVLYAGLMIDEQGDPSVLEFNVRFGDPETQPLLMRLKSDLVPYFCASIEGQLDKMLPLEWDSRFAVGVVMAARNYPQTPDKGPKGNEYIILGMDAANALPNTTVFEAGVRRDEHGLPRVNGGRVLCVTSLGTTLQEAADKAYSGVSKISWEGEYHRTDIGYR